MKFIPFFLFSLLSLNLFSQISGVTIIGRMPQRNDGEIIAFEKPIGNYPRSFYMNQKDNRQIINNSFSTTIPLSTSGFIYVYEKPFYKPFAKLFAEPGDTIRFSYADNQITFSGKNAAFNNLYANKKIFTAWDPDFSVNDLLRNADSASEMITSVQTKRKEFIEKYREMLNEKAISEKCFKVLTNEIDQNLDNWLGHLAENARIENFRSRENITLDLAEAQKLVEIQNTKYNISNPDNYASIFLADNIYMTAWNMEQKARNTHRTVKRFWNKYDDIFKLTIGNFGVIDFIESDDYREIFVADGIFSALKFMTVEPKSLAPVFKSFVEKYPNSVYIGPLAEKLFDIVPEEISTPQKNNTNTSIFGKISIYNSVTGLSLSNDTNIPQEKSLKEILDRKFANQNIFIDGWATYCAPCIQEFKHNPELQDFLGKNAVQTLYVSIDNEVSVSLWKKLIADYNLKGFHLFAGPGLMDSVISLFQYVPRYFIYTKDGQLTRLEGNPSDKKRFYKQILNKINP